MSHDLNWAGNPMNRKQQLAQVALPQLLFRECHMKCVDTETFLASTEAEKTCVANCQDKTYQAFDKYMQIKMLMEANKKHDTLLDISRYTEMEIEHSHDTESVLPKKHGTHAASTSRTLPQTKARMQAYYGQDFQRQ